MIARFVIFPAVMAAVFSSFIWMKAWLYGTNAQTWGDVEHRSVIVYLIMFGVFLLVAVLNPSRGPTSRS